MPGCQPGGNAGSGSESGGDPVPGGVAWAPPGGSGCMRQGYRRVFPIRPRSIDPVTFAAHVLEFLLIAALMAGLALAVAFFVARSYVRRHWRLMRGHVATRGVLATLALFAAGRERYATKATPEQLSQGTAVRVRRRMWVAVEDAEHAVDHASSRDAPVADLPAVCRSLQTVAGELDGLLRLERRLPRGAERTDAVRVQVAEVIAASRDVQAAALQAGSDATEPQVRSMVRQARDEVDIVSAALSRLRSLGQPH